ncbi:hypothetical protein Tco_0732405 [Tanacetum coccineum]
MGMTARVKVTTTSASTGVSQLGILTRVMLQVLQVIGGQLRLCPPPPLCTTCGKPSVRVFVISYWGMFYLRATHNKVKDVPKWKQKQSMPAEFARLHPTTDWFMLHYSVISGQDIKVLLPDFDVILAWIGLASLELTIDLLSIPVIFGKRSANAEYVLSWFFLTAFKSVLAHLAMKARTLISHGCQGFLASVMDTSLESPNIENLSVVREFADVFPDELPGLPPAREIEFDIELIPSAEPISKLRSRRRQERHLRIVLEILRQKKFVCDSFPKCRVRLQQDAFTLVILVSATHHMPSKVESNHQMPRPTTSDGGEKFSWACWLLPRLLLKRQRVLRIETKIVSAPIIDYFHQFPRFSDITVCNEESLGLCFDATLEGDPPTIQEQHTRNDDRLCVPNDQALREKVSEWKTHNSPLYYSSRFNQKLQRLETLLFGRNGMKKDVAIFIPTVGKGMIISPWISLLLCLQLRKDMLRFGGCDRLNHLLIPVPIQKNDGFISGRDFFDRKSLARDEYLCLWRFAYNNSWHASIKAATFRSFVWRILKELDPTEELLLIRINVTLRVSIEIVISKVRQSEEGYHYHPLHVASYPFDQIQPDMSLSEEPESILDRQERVMRNKVIPFVKILWKNHPEREATWETEESMRASYPHFFV